MIPERRKRFEKGFVQVDKDILEVKRFKDEQISVSYKLSNHERNYYGQSVDASLIGIVDQMVSLRDYIVHKDKRGFIMIEGWGLFQTEQDFFDAVKLQFKKASEILYEE